MNTGLRHVIAAGFALLVASTPSCVDHPDFLDSQKQKPWENRCDGEAPTCMSSCAEARPLGRAICSDSVWRCELGIQDDLCCDPAISPDHCETWRGPCAGGQPCPGGYTCVASRTHPIPSEAGLCRLGELSVPGALSHCDLNNLTDPRTLAVSGATPVKVYGVVNVEMSCEDRKCTPSDPCCQHCSGAYMAHLIDETYGEQLTLPIRTETVACGGTNCGFSCFPMHPARPQVIWGLFMPDAHPGAPGMLYYVGHCEL